MTELKEQWQSGEWKSEKHVPVIDCPDSFKKSETITVKVTVGKEIPHPNTTAHHIQWIELYFLPDGEKFSYHVARYECAAHGASIQGPDTSTVYANPAVSIEFRTDKPGVLMAASYCNIHGLWQSAKKVHSLK